MVHIKDVFDILATGAPHPRDITALIREPVYVPQSRGTLDLLADMRQRRVHLAIVLDEYSGTEGLVTIEDLVAEIVGDIEDEHAEAPTALIVPIECGGRESEAHAEVAAIASARYPRPAATDDEHDALTSTANTKRGRTRAETGGR